METQICRCCGTSKPLHDFHFRTDNGKYRTNCKKCRNDGEAARRYNVSVGFIEEIRVAQDNKCAICGIHSSNIEHASFDTNPLVIDHDHETGAVRGLLCPTCNSGLGYFKDNISYLLSAAQYLLKSGKDIV